MRCEQILIFQTSHDSFINNKVITNFIISSLKICKGLGQGTEKILKLDFMSKGTCNMLKGVHYVCQCLSLFSQSKKRTGRCHILDKLMLLQRKFENELINFGRNFFRLLYVQFCCNLCSYVYKCISYLILHWQWNNGRPGQQRRNKILHTVLHVPKYHSHWKPKKTEINVCP